MLNNLPRAGQPAFLKAISSHCFAAKCIKMSTISSATYMDASEVLELVRAGDSTVVIDVREDDRLGGHIKGSKHIPAPTFRSNPGRYLDVANGKENVVFHCMFSQYRGPSSAAAFIEAWNSQTKPKSATPRVVILSGGFNAVSKLALEGKDLDVIEKFDRELYM